MQFLCDTYDVQLSGLWYFEENLYKFEATIVDSLDYPEPPEDFQLQFVAQIFVDVVSDIPDILLNDLLRFVEWFAKAMMT